MTRFFSFLIVGVIASVLIGGCDPSFHATNNSSQGDNDYFEEPISERSEKYSAALETSNKFIELFADGQLANARALLDSRLQEVVSDEDFEKMHQKVFSDFGPFLAYKPMQWGFSTNSELENIVVSIKIVVHESSQVFYILNFEDDGSYQNIIGFNISPRANDESVAQAATRAPGLD